jgi:hypothetical protein
VCVYTVYWLFAAGLGEHRVRPVSRQKSDRRVGGRLSNLALANQKAGGIAAAQHCSIPRRARVLGPSRLCPHPVGLSPSCTMAWHGMAWCYCIVLPRLTADACLPARLPRARPCSRPALVLQAPNAAANTLRIVWAIQAPPPKRTAPVQRRGPASRGGAAPGPLHSNGYGCIWISSWISSAGLQLLTSRRGPGRREPLGYIGSHRRRAYHGPVSPPVSARVGPSNATRQPNRALLTAARPAVALLPPPSAPLKIGGVPLVAIAIPST